MKLKTDGYLHLILGPMFAGKTSRVIEIINRFECILVPVLVINNILDNRYADSNFICSHNKLKKSCVSAKNLLELKENKEYKTSKVILIEEGHFFNDLYEFVIHAVDVDKKHVIVCGLDGDYQKKPFESISKLIPHAEKKEFLYAYCTLCKNGTEAHFTQRLTDTSDDQILVGGMKDYMPVCRKHYNFNIKK